MPEPPFLGGWSPRKPAEEPLAGGKGVTTSSPRTLPLVVRCSMFAALGLAL